MVYTNEMIQTQKQLKDFKAGDVVWITSFADEGFDRITIVGPGVRKGYMTYYKDDGKLYYATETMSCWDWNPGSVWPKMRTLTTEDLLNIFWFFDKHGLIRDDLSFDPEHFMETVAKEHLPNFDYHKHKSK